MATIVVDIAGMQITRNPEDILITYSLGSCVGVSIYDPVLRIGGLIHCMLPLSKVDPEKAAQRPYMFVDTGVSMMLNRLYDMGLKKSRAVISVAGGAQVLDDKGVFKIGERNVTVLRKLFWKNSLLMHVQEVGGKTSRTVSLEIGSGRFNIKAAGTTTHYDI